MIDWNDAFDNSGYVPGSAALAEVWAERAWEFRETSERLGRARLGLSYGSGDRNQFDLFVPEDRPVGLVVFVHGGYWHKFDRSYWSHMAEGPLTRGWAVAIPSYTLAPEARISQITQEIGQAVNRAAGEVEGPLRLIGHSAGGHLVTRMLCDDSPLDGSVQDRLERVVSLSGVHDLRLLMQTAMNGTLGLTNDEAAAESPALHHRQGAVPVCFWVGAAERPEFLRQTRLMAEAWQGDGVSDVYEPGKNHFTVVDGLSDPDSALVETLLD